MNEQPTIYTTIDSQFGTVLVSARCGKIRGVRVLGRSSAFEPTPSWKRSDSALADARSQLAAYFAGGLREFSLPLELEGTPFQLHAWRVLRAVTYGTTTTYGQIATQMGRPHASRAVGGAMSKNPIAVIVPCHRVVGKNASLTGYAGGLNMKRRLLAMESAR